MLRNFADQDLADFWRTGKSRHIPADLHAALKRKLVYLDSANSLNDLRLPPANRLEALRGDLRGNHSIRVNKQWRLVFRWLENGPECVRLLDYH